MRGSRLWRVTWTIATIVVVQSAVCAAAILPVALVWQSAWMWLPADPLARTVAVSAAVLPSYGAFAVILMFVSAGVTRALGWHTPPDSEMRIADLDWPLLTWVRFMAALHVVRVFAGILARGTPVWSAYLRACGARVGRRVYVNSLAASDYNLLELGDDVVIGADVHVAGHTVERGVVRTARVRIDDGVTIGIGTIVEIGVHIRTGCQVGALSFVPKYATLEANTTYVGVPVRRLDQQVVG